MTLEAIGPDMVDLTSDLARFAPPAEAVDKPVHSPRLGSDLRQRLRKRDCRTLVATGGETDMRVLATLPGAADLGHRAILAGDAVCSSSDDDHDAMPDLFGRRYRPRVEIATADEVASLRSSRRWG